MKDSGQFDTFLSSALPQSVSLLQELIQVPSSRGEERCVQEHVADLFRCRGAEVSEVEVDPVRLANMPGFSPSELSYAGRPNVVGCLRGEGGGRSLALNFHVDTAPPGPHELWEHDPYSGKFRNGRVYGRGAWDDKAGCVLALLVVDALRHAGVRLKGDLILQSVIEDEHTGNGTLALVERGYGADGAVVLDGAYGPRVILGHPGYTNFRVTVYGKAAPSCRSETGENAIEKCFLLMQRLRALEMEFNADLQPPWSSVTHPVNFNPGTILGGEWTGAVPAKCAFEAQMSFLPPFTLESFRERLREEISAVAEADPWLTENTPGIEFFDLATEPVQVADGGEFLSLLDDSCRAVFERGLDRTLVTGWCDLRHFSLFKPTPCCLFGPGKGANGHRPNEYFEVDDLLPHARVLLGFITQWCGASGA